MSREIKFRAYLPKDYPGYEKGMHYDVVTKNGKMCSMEDWEIMGFISEAIVEQYTGLKDKNGVEIYEGDIVSITSEVCYPGDIGVVGFDDKKGMYDIYDIENGKVYWNSGDTLCSLMGRKDFTSEVIGNIHESPELLEDK